MTAAFPVGRSVSRTVRMTAGLIDSFVLLSGDCSPLHVDDSFARARGFLGRVAHGALLGALVSGVIGTELPGEAGVLQEIHLAFHNPCYEGDELTIEVHVSEEHVSVNALSCQIRVCSSDGRLLAKGGFRSGLVVSR